MTELKDIERNDDAKTLEERIESQIKKRHFNVSYCPESVFNDFKRFAVEEAQNNYAMAIKLLLDRSTVWRMASAMERRMDDFLILARGLGDKVMFIEQNLQRLTPTKSNDSQEKTKRKTFGKKE